MVAKPNGEWRPCGAYRALNKITVADKYPVPYLTDFRMNLHETVIFSKLDLIKAFPQIPVNPDDSRNLVKVNPAILNNFLKGTTKKNNNREIQWTEESLNAFDVCKKSLVDAMFLCHPVPNAKLALKVDASNNAVGAVIEQFVDNSWQPLGFFSKRLNATQA